MKPRAASRSARRSRMMPEHDLVGHQLARVHRRLGATAISVPRGHGAAQQVSGGDLGDAEALDQTLGLGALSRTRGPHEHDTHP